MGTAVFLLALRLSLSSWVNGYAIKDHATRTSWLDKMERVVRSHRSTLTSSTPLALNGAYEKQLLVMKSGTKSFSFFVHMAMSMGTVVFLTTLKWSLSSWVGGQGRRDNFTRSSWLDKKERGLGSHRSALTISMPLALNGTTQEEQLLMMKSGTKSLNFF